MLGLLLTLFISLFSICPSNYQIEDRTENNIKRSIDYWEDDNGTLVISQGYTTNFQELACSETWLKMEETFGTIWSDFNTDYDNWYYSTVIPCDNLYVLIPTYFSSNLSYNVAYDYVTSNYSSYRITSMRIYNRRYYPYNSSIQAYAHTIDFYYGRYNLECTFYKSVAGANQCAYSVRAYLYEENVSGSTYIDTYQYCMFAANNFTYTDTFFVSDYWLISEDAAEQYRDGYNTGYNVGVEVGKTAGETTGYGNGYQEGYVEGLAHADYDSTALTIMKGIIDVGLLPVNVFLMILNFEVFGVNVSGFVSALLTISIVIIIVRFLFGGKNNDK